MVEINRRDFMKGVLVGGACVVFGLEGNYEKKREIVWSEEIEIEAKLKNEVRDLMDEKNKGIIYFDGRHLLGFNKYNISSGEFSFNDICEIKDRLLHSKKYDCYGYVRVKEHDFLSNFRLGEHLA